MHDAVAGVFERAGEAEFVGCGGASEEGTGHGRVEGRYVTVVENPDGLPDGWADVGSVVLVGRERSVGGVRGADTTHDYLTSLRARAEALAGYIRNHWGIENGLHGVLDVAFRGDDSRTRSGHAAANLGMVRRVPLSLLKRTQVKGSIRTRRLRAGWDDDYLLQVVRGTIARDRA